MQAKKAKQLLSQIPDHEDIVIFWYQKSDAEVDAAGFTDKEEYKLKDESWQQVIKFFSGTSWETAIYDTIRDAVWQTDEIQAALKEGKE